MRGRFGAGARALVWIAVLSGCAGGPSGGGRRDSSVIQRSELEVDGVSTLTVYDAIQRLRPGWLAPRAATSVSNGAGPLPAVLVGNAPRRDVEILRSIPVGDVAELRYVNARDATTRYGTGYVNGLIEVRPRTGAR